MGTMAKVDDPVPNVAMFYVPELVPETFRSLHNSWPKNFGSVNYPKEIESELRNTNGSLDYDVPTIAVDDLNLRRLDFVKIDVEGHEVAALRGMRRSILRYKPAIYVEDDRAASSTANDGGAQSEAISQFMKEVQYVCVEHYVPYFNNYNYKGGDPWNEEVAWIWGRPVSSAHNKLFLHISSEGELREIVDGWGTVPYGAPLPGQQPKKYNHNNT